MRGEPVTFEVLLSTEDWTEAREFIAWERRRGADEGEREAE